jgi:hypothetical protein
VQALGLSVSGATMGQHTLPCAAAITQLPLGPTLASHILTPTPTPYPPRPHQMLGDQQAAADLL